VSDEKNSADSIQLVEGSWRVPYAAAQACGNRMFHGIQHVGTVRMEWSHELLRRSQTIVAAAVSSSENAPARDERHSLLIVEEDVQPMSDGSSSNAHWRSRMKRTTAQGQIPSSPGHFSVEPFESTRTHSGNALRAATRKHRRRTLDWLLSDSTMYGLLSRSRRRPRT
jgi:hypothetical protein